jgi:hypothetical protein
MKRKTSSKPPLAPAIKTLANTIINNTPDGSVGYDEAANTISEIWDQFDEAGATPADMEQITGYLRWAKWEGFCINSPI